MSDTTGTVLPPLEDDTIARIERAVFEEIDDERRHAAAASAPRPRRRWLTVAGVAAAFVIGALISPPLLSSIGPAGVSESMPAIGDGAMPHTADQSAGGTAESAVPPVKAEDGATQREIISTAQVTLEVADVQDATDAIARLAGEHDGYVESASVGSSGAEVSMPEPPPASGTGRIGIRIPSEDLEQVIGALGKYGEVLSTSISRQDVTSVAVDLRARVDALRASVQRLTELMSKSGSVADLIAAETALSDRQAQLESYEQELERLQDQVALSSVSVQLIERTSTSADPAGFADGLLAGWNGMVVAFNAVVVAFGFVLPWLVPIAIVAGIWWLARRRSRRRRTNEDSGRITQEG